MIDTYKQIQHLCRQIISDLCPQISVGQSEHDIKLMCEALIRQHNINEFWYHNIPVMVSIGSHTLSSLSGKHYVANHQSILQAHDFLTVDLSLAINNHWGIYAKSLAMEAGCITSHHFSNPELQALKMISDELHQHVLDVVTPEMSFHELYHEMDKKIKFHHVQHLDFRHNFGHSIEKILDDRFFIENQQHLKLDNKLFSFEPHIKFINGTYGFKRAEIYCVDKEGARIV